MSPIKQGILPTPLVGIRKAQRKGFLSSLSYGQSVAVNNKAVSFVTKIKEAKKQVNPTTTILLADTPFGVVQPRIHRGLSTYGIGYTPTVVEEEIKTIRRWPRDWHGDNIKN